MTQERLIKKYANRRLYDATQSRHITLDDIRTLIVKGEKIRVVEDKTGHDITRHILLQVIAEQEQGGDPIFTTEILSFLLRFYGNPMQSSIGRYLELSIRMFLDQQGNFTEQLRGMLGQAQQPLSILKELADRQVPIWRSVRKEFLKNLSRPKP